MSYLDFVEQGANAPTPASGWLRLFAKSDGVYLIDDAGSVVGPIMTFPLNFPAATELTIDASGEIVLTGSHHKIDTFGDASTDDLETIDPATAPASNLVILRPEHTDRSVVIKHNVGNIFLSGGADITLDNIEDHIMLFYDDTQWVNLQ